MTSSLIASASDKGRMRDRDNDIRFHPRTCLHRYLFLLFLSPLDLHLCNHNLCSTTRSSGRRLTRKSGLTLNHEISNDSMKDRSCANEFSTSAWRAIAAEKEKSRRTTVEAPLTQFLEIPTCFRCVISIQLKGDL